MKSLHPTITFIYFLMIFGFSMTVLNPIIVFTSACAAFSYSVFLSGKGAVRFNLIFVIPVLVIVAVVNPLVNHQGMNILFYISYNPVTFEAVLYGISTGLMFASVIMWFSCFNVIMTSDKIIYLFGRILPGLSLIFSMTLRFVPRFKSQIKKISDSQKCIGTDVTQGKLGERIKRGLKIVSTMITWALENAVDTADSMRARGYGLPNRTSFHFFKFERRDISVMIILISLAVIICVSYKYINITYFPEIYYQELGAISFMGIAAFVLMSVFPLLIELADRIIWRKTAYENI